MNPSKRKFASRLIVLGVVIVIVVAAVVVGRLFSAVAPSNLISLSGRIEGDTSDLAPNIGGRVVAVRFREGDTVRAGEVVAIVNGAQTRAREAQARAALTAAQAKAQSERDQIAVLDTQLDAAQADLAQSRASDRLASFTEQSDVALYRTGDVSKQQELAAISTAEQTAAEVAARSAQVASVNQSIAQQFATIASATAETQQARGGLAEASANGRDLVVRAPFAGTVMSLAPTFRGLHSKSTASSPTLTSTHSRSVASTSSR